MRRLVLVFLLSWLPLSAPFLVSGPVIPSNRILHGAGGQAGAVARLTPRPTRSCSPRIDRSFLLSASAGSQSSEASCPIFQETGDVQPGSVLVSSPDESDHFFRQAVVLVIDHGEYGSRGVLLEMATAFSIGEMVESMQHTALGENKLFRGGSDGEDKVMMLHTFAGVDGAIQVGDSGVYIGGSESAQDLVVNGHLPRSGFKFIFNQCEWGPGKLEREVRQGTFRVGVMTAELATRQVAGQSERMRIFDKAGRIDPDEPLWEILRGEMGLKGPKAKVAKPQKTEEKLDSKKMMILGMVVERIFELRNKRDGVGLLPLLDLDAIVFEQQGNENILEAFEASWFDSTARLELNTDTVHVKDDGTVTYDFTEVTDSKPEGTIRQGKIKFSPYGMIRELEEDVWWKD